jgi:chromosome segregation ATPase
MRTSDWLKTAAMVAGMCLAALGSYAQNQGSSQQTGDPVADAARKARQEKEKRNAQKPKKVFTDDDVKPATPDKPEVQNASASAATPSAAEATASAGAQKPEDAAKKDNAEEKEDPNSEKAWRKRFGAQHEKIAKVEKELEILQRELEKSSLQYYPDPTKAMNEQNSRAEINAKTAKIAEKKKELEQLKQQLDDLETELRKAGGDPGWAQ